MASIPPTPRYGHTQNAKPPSQAPLSNIAPKLDSTRENVPTNPESLHTLLDQPDQVKEHRAYSTYQNSLDKALCKLVGDSSRYGGSLADVPTDNLNASDPVEHRGNTNERVSNVPDTHRQSSSSHGNIPKPQSNTAPRADGSNGQSHTAGPSVHKLIFKSSIGDERSTLLTQSYRGSVDDPLSIVQNDTSRPRLLYPETPALPIVGVQRLPFSEWLLETGSESRPGEIRREEGRQGIVDHHKAGTFGLEFPQRIPASHEREVQTMAAEDDVRQKCESNVRQGGQELREAVVPCSELLDIFDEDENAEVQYPDSETVFTEYEQDHLKNNDLGIFVALQATQDQQDQSLRTYHSFIDCYAPDMLTMYQPSARSSPLSDSVTARIFYHFINVIAPSISMYERHPANPSLLFQGRPVHISQQHIWACKFPFQIYIYTSSHRA
jgi:hypothetical protein